MNRVFLQSLILVAALSAFPAQVLADPRARTSFYVDSYGVVSSETTPYARRAQKIFKKLKRTVGQSVSGAKLVVVNSTGKPWAIALADGNIILSKGSLDVMSLAQTAEQADAWLAFVLGHELAHLANKDLWHHRIHATLSGSSQLESLKQVREELEYQSVDLQDIRERELKADETGYTFAALAGYNTSLIFTNTDRASSFLDVWAEQTSSLVDQEHHSPTERTDFLRVRLEELHKQTELFNYGVRLAHFGRYQDALYILEDFHRKFPSRQVLSNLGYVLIQLARQEMPASLAYRFWFPTMLESNSGVPSFGRQWQNQLSEVVTDQLQRAVDVLTTAARMDSSDLVSRLNLVTAYLYLGENFKARAIVEEAIKINPTSSQLQGLRALVLLDEDTSIDMWQRVVEILNVLTSSPKPPDNILYNLAQLLTERGRHGQALVYWRLLKDRYENLPEVYASIVCHELQKSDPCNGIANPNVFSQPNWVLPTSLGTDVDSPIARKELEGWSRSNSRIGPLNVDILLNGRGDSVLAIDHRVEMVSLGDSSIKDAAELEARIGEPALVMPMSQGTLWSYGPAWSALLQDGQIAEIWVAR